MKLQNIPRKKINIEEYQLRFMSGVMEIDSLARSIEEVCLISPLSVRRSGANYRLIAGQRRLAALDRLGWKDIPCVILDSRGKADDLVKGIVENIERLDLSPLDRAKRFAEAIENYGYSEEKLARVISRSRTYISHHLRLLKKVHPLIQQYVHEGKLTFGHARVLMQLEDRKKQLEIADRIIKDGLTIRVTASIVAQARPLEEETDTEKGMNATERIVWKVRE